jgi:hypothetical protein
MVRIAARSSRIGFLNLFSRVDLKAAEQRNSCSYDPDYNPLTVLAESVDDLPMTLGHSKWITAEEYPVSQQRLLTPSRQIPPAAYGQGKGELW